jgi:hypothetical protein
MYNKLFTKILDSSIWLAPDPHRLVWITLIAAMDEDGNAMFASAGNLAARARVTREQAELAISDFEATDPDSGDPDNEGRRIERFPGGWHVLNAHKYRDMVTKAIIREQTRVRTANYRAKQRAGDAPVTQEERTSDAPVTTSRALSRAEAEKIVPTVLVGKPDTYSVPKCPIQDLLSAYHELCPSMSKVRILTNMRQKHAAARWRDVCVKEKWETEQALDWFRWYFKRCESSDFLAGRANGSKRPWRADFEWLLIAGNFAKVIEGKYHELR